MFYQLFEMNHAALGPARAAADATRLYFRNPMNPFSQTAFGRSFSAACEVFERTTRRYEKPVFGLSSTLVGGTRVAVTERVAWEKPFCRMIHFERDLPEGTRRVDPRVLLVAPMSGHYATLLRGTVEALMPRHDVYITDWTDARMVPMTAGTFDLNDYIDYVIEMLQVLGPNTHVVAVCQPSVPVLAAVSVMEENDDPAAPASMILMGGPIDTRISPTAVNALAIDKGIDWFARNVIMPVPFPHAGFMRPVYPGFLQLSGFMSMNLDRHLVAHKEFFVHLVKGDGDPASKHREFYDEYLAVMDLTAEFYLQTVETVFIDHALPRGQMHHRGRLVNPKAIRRTAMLTVEGEFDDITGMGQTQAAHALATNIPDNMRADYVQTGVGHYGVFNGSRFRSEISPRMTDFMLTHDHRLQRKADGVAPAKPTGEKVGRAASTKRARPTPDQRRASKAARGRNVAAAE